MSDLIPVGADSELTEFAAERLYRVTEITDFSAGTIKIFQPVLTTGADDLSRDTKYISSVNVAYKGMPATVPFEIAARSLSLAVAGWREAALIAAEAYLQKAEQESLQRSILAPNFAGGHRPRSVN